MTEEDIKIITKEEYLNDEGTEQKIIFESNIFDEIKGKELDLSVEKIFKIPKKKRRILCSMPKGTCNRL